MSKPPETLSWSSTKIRILTKRKSSILTSHVLQTRRISALCSRLWRTQFSSSTWGSSTWFKSCCAHLTHPTGQDLRAPPFCLPLLVTAPPQLAAPGPRRRPQGRVMDGLRCWSSANLVKAFVFRFLFLTFGYEILCKFWIWYFIEILKATVIYCVVALS